MNLLQSAAKISKSSKFIVQLHCNRWSDIAHCNGIRTHNHLVRKRTLNHLAIWPNHLARLLNVFNVFFCRIRDPHLFSRSGIKATEGFSVISNLPATTRIAINYNEFFSESLKRNKVLILHLDLKITFNLQYGKFPSMVCISLVLKSSEALSKYSTPF